LQAQGLDGKNIEYLTVEDMASHYIKEIKTVQESGPYYLGGFCLGGLLAFEMAQQLKRDGEEVALLALISTLTPDYSKNIYSNRANFRGLLYKIYERIDLELNNISVLDPQAKLTYFLSRIRRLISLLLVKGERLSERLFIKNSNNKNHSQSYLLEVIDDYHERAFYEYCPRPYSGNLTLFRVSKQRKHVHPDLNLGWGKFVEGEIDNHEIDAYHKNILKMPNVISLTQKLNACIKETTFPDRNSMHV
jgi:thioesterase domain-containing protein